MGNITISVTQEDSIYSERIQIKYECNYLAILVPEHDSLTRAV